MIFNKKYAQILPGLRWASDSLSGDYEEGYIPEFNPAEFRRRFERTVTIRTISCLDRTAWICIPQDTIFREPGT